MDKLKNCPNCGGILDDTGRCMYCKSKVYDLTDINIDLNTSDLLLMTVKYNDQTMIMKVRPTNLTVKCEPICREFILDGRTPSHSFMGNDMVIDMELRACWD